MTPRVYEPSCTQYSAKGKTAKTKVSTAASKLSGVCCSQGVALSSRQCVLDSAACSSCVVPSVVPLNVGQQVLQLGTADFARHAISSNV